MDEFKRLLGVVALTLNKSEAEVEEAVKSDEAVAQLTADFKAYRKTQFDDGVKAAEKKTKSTVEAALRKRGADIDSFDQLDAALDQLETTAREKAGQKLTDEDVQKHPSVVKLLNAKDREKEQAVAQARTEAEKAVEEKVQAFRQEQTAAKVQAAAEAKIRELNPVLSQDATRAANQVKALVKEIQAGKYEVTESGDILPLDDNGQYRKNELGHTVKFDEVVRGLVTSYYDLPVSSPKDSPGIKPQDVTRDQSGAQFTHFKGQAPKTKEEYINLANDPTLKPEALKEVQTYWQEHGAKE